MSGFKGVDIPVLTEADLYEIQGKALETKTEKQKPRTTGASKKTTPVAKLEPELVELSEPEPESVELPEPEPVELELEPEPAEPEPEPDPDTTESGLEPEPEPELEPEPDLVEKAEPKRSVSKNKKKRGK